MLKTSVRSRCALAAAAAVTLLLTACAPMQPNLIQVGRAQLQLPAGEWERLDQGEADTFNVLPDDVSHDLPMRTQAVALRGPQQEVLALLVVQTNATNDPRDTTLWSQSCPHQKGVQVTDFAKGSPVRVDCLQYKRLASEKDYLTSQRPVLQEWAQRHHALPALPFAHASYRFATAEGGYMLVEALVDQRLLRPKTVGTDQFLTAGRPAQEWLIQLVEGAKNSVAMLDGRFVVPPFPVPLPQ